MAGAAVAVGLRTVFMVMGCVITATVIYTVVTDGFPFRKQLLTPVHPENRLVWRSPPQKCKNCSLYPEIAINVGLCTLNQIPQKKDDSGVAKSSKKKIGLVSCSVDKERWMAATLVDFYINILGIGAWIVYKESSWIHALLWIVLLICLGSITTCGYIVMQFLKLTPQESLQDPIYFVLLRDRKRDGTESKSILSVVSARVLFGVLGCLMLGTLIYTIATDGSPFRREVLTPWLSATLIDFYVNVFALSVWVAYKESNWTTAAFWIILLICFGSISTCAYIVLQLFHLSAQNPVSLILFNSNRRTVNGYEGTLQTNKYTVG